MIIVIRKDYHIHTSHSDDCNIPMEEMILSALDKGFNEIALTDHVDFDYPDREKAFVVDYDVYTEEFFPLKEKYKNKINILLGVEIGLQPHLTEDIKKLLNSYPFDFAIGSSHTINSMDVYMPKFFEGKSQKEAYTEYFLDVLNCSKMTNCYNVYGHLDYINRYGNFESKVLQYKDYSDIIDEILKVIIENGKGLEVNTSGFRYGLNQSHPQRDILIRYKELGGEILVAGSDSHRPQDIGCSFDYVHHTLKDIGYRYLASFEKMKPVMYKID